jgi:ketosteroid isomerase-like protein
MSPPPYEFPEDPSPQLEVIRKYYAFLSAFDFENLSTLMADDFTQQTAPLSLGVPKRTKSDLLAFLGQFQAYVKGQHLDVSRAQMTHFVLIVNLLDSTPYTISTME